MILPEIFSPAAFRNPEGKYRSVAFFSLNDELKAEEIRRQLAGFKEAGFGGSFFHSRIGLLTPYLDRQFFELIAAGVKNCQELGLDSWFYDEDQWPSGFAGGIVPRQNPSFQARCLVRLPKTQTLKKDDRILFADQDFHYVSHVFPMGDPRFNGTAWVDLLNPETVRAFIDCTYVPYAEKFAGQPGVVGIFTDEPQVNPWPKIPHQGAIPFSPVLVEAFHSRTGQTLLPLMPSLFAEVGDWRRIRLDYYRTVAACFEDSFSRQIGETCRKAGLLFTGHYNAEDSPSGGMLNEGGLMQQYRHMDIPGIDALGLRYQSLHCGKVMTSVANQYGRRRRISELFGIAGHNLSFEDRIWLTAWHTLMGVNLMCPHLSLYSIKGERKRDFPPTISSHQPYWPDNKLFEDYSARLCYFAAIGTTLAELCVLSPIESDYIEHASGRAQHYDQSLDQLLNLLMGFHRNIDLGDEQIISEIARVENGRLVMGEMAYPIVVLPALLTIRSCTIDLLIELVRQGGAILVYGQYPEYVDGVEAPDRLSLLKKSSRLISSEEWQSALDRALPAVFQLADPEACGIWTHLRQVDQGYSLQLSNTSRLQGNIISLRLDLKEGSPLLFDPVDGSLQSLRPEADGTFRLAFAPTQTWIVLFGEAALAIGAQAVYRTPSPDRHELMKLDRPWTGRKRGPNALTLDFARFSCDGGLTWSEPEPVLAIRDRFALSEPFAGDLVLKFEPFLEQLPAQCYLAVEQPGMYHTISINGTPVDFKGEPFYLDPVLRQSEIGSFLRPGHNEILLGLNFTSAQPASFDACARYGSEIESIYLVGDFGVRAERSASPVLESDRNRKDFLVKKPVYRFNRFVVTRENSPFSFLPDNLDLTVQGYPFFAGEFELETSFELPDNFGIKKQVLLAFPSFEAILLKVRINKTDLPPLFTSPWEINLTGLLRPGTNQLRVTLTNSLRNLLGPHHHLGGEHVAVGPATFRANNNWPNIGRGEEDWYNARRENRSKTWSDDYHMISFGFLQAPILVEIRNPEG